MLMIVNSVTSLPTVTVMRSASGGPLKQLMSKHDSQMSEAVVIIDLNRAPTISPTMLDEGLEVYATKIDPQTDAPYLVVAGEC